MLQRDVCLRLNGIPQLGPLRAHRLLRDFGDLQRLAAASVQELRRIEGIDAALAAAIAGALRDARGPERELAAAQRAGAAIIALGDAEYPEALRTIPDPPLILYRRGAWRGGSACHIAVVGSRNASLYGVSCAEQLGYELAERGLTVVSGLARGIDAAAHRGALKANGCTVAVLGSGLDRVYPPEHAELAEQIQRQGAVLSEYPMQASPLSHHFPQRNRVISGLSLGVVVVEAARRSGALGTARLALEQGRDVFAVPGPIRSPTSQGTHDLLKDGARLVSSVEDIIDELGLVPMEAATSKTGRASTGATVNDLTAAEARVYACVTDQPRWLDVIASACGLSVMETSAALLQLELKRVVRQIPGKQFLRALIG